jgi:uncharacterized membrane protein (TIGR02234 family)
MNARRELLTAVVLAAAGATLALVAAGRPWAHAAVVEGPLRFTVSPSGRAVAPPLAALAIAGLAGSVAVLAARRFGRLLTGAVLLLAGTGMAVSSLYAAATLETAVRPEAGRAVGQREAAPSSVDATAWPALAALGGLLTAGSGALTLVRGRRWPGMSERYEPSSPARGPGEPARGPGGMWDALDRGDDPTA